MAGYHTRWVRPEEQPEDPERIAIREALAFGKALYDRRNELGLSVPELAERAGMTADEIECIGRGRHHPDGGASPAPGSRRSMRTARPHRRARPGIGLVRSPRRLSDPVGAIPAPQRA